MQGQPHILVFDLSRAQQVIVLEVFTCVDCFFGALSATKRQWVSSNSINFHCFICRAIKCLRLSLKCAQTATYTSSNVTAVSVILGKVRPSVFMCPRPRSQMHLQCTLNAPEGQEQFFFKHEFRTSWLRMFCFSSKS
jgi:hypothetical protein